MVWTWALGRARSSTDAHFGDAPMMSGGKIAFGKHRSTFATTTAARSHREPSGAPTSPPATGDVPRLNSSVAAQSGGTRGNSCDLDCDGQTFLSVQCGIFSLADRNVCPTV